MAENKAEKTANKFLKSEMEKRWSLYYKFRRDNCWIANIGPEKLLPLVVESYTPRDVNILRLTDKHTPLICPLHKNYSCQGMCYKNSAPEGRWPSLEATFYLDEMEEIIPWTLDNYRSVKTISPLIDDEALGSGTVRMLHPPSYFWTKRAKTKLIEVCQRY